MKKPKFEIVLAEIAERMNINTLELLCLASELRAQDLTSEFSEPSEEYIEMSCKNLETSENCHDLDVIFNELKN